MMKSWIVAGLCAAALASGCATSAAQAQNYTAALAPGAGVESSGAGAGVFTFDPATKVLTYSVTYDGLTGPATMAHIHGPADPGENAGVVIGFANAASPITGAAELSEAQAAELQAGKYYVNVHTAAHRGGEIRGQITPAP